MRRAVASGCALVALGCACSGSSKYPDGQSTTTTGSRSTTTKSPVPTTPPPITAPPGLSTPPLTSLILSTAPAGYTLQPNDVGDTGPTDLEKAARDDVSPDAREVLLQSGFLRGYQRLWRSVDASGEDLDQNFIFLYEFETPEGAQEFAEHWRQTLLATKGQATLESFGPPFIPGAIGLKTQDDRGSTGVVIFTKGVYAVEALVNGGPLADQAPPAIQSALGQYQLLP